MARTKGSISKPVEPTILDGIDGMNDAYKRKFLKACEMYNTEEQIEMLKVMIEAAALGLIKVKSKGLKVVKE